MILAVLRRLRLMVVTLAAISVLSFLLIQAPPGNYLDTYVTQLRMQGDAIDDARIEALEARYGLERPMHVQYLKWIWGVLRGDLGRSMAHNMEVNKLLAQRLPASLWSNRLDRTTPSLRLRHRGAKDAGRPHDQTNTSGSSGE